MFGYLCVKTAAGDWTPYGEWFGLPPVLPEVGDEMATPLVSGAVVHRQWVQLPEGGWVVAIYLDRISLNSAAVVPGVKDQNSPTVLLGPDTPQFVQGTLPE